MAIEVSGTMVFYALLALTLLTVGIVFVARYMMSKLNEGSLNEKYSKLSEKTISSNRAKFVEADVFSMSSSFFNYGLVVALVITVLALGLTEYADKVDGGDNFVMIEEDIEIEPPRTAEPPPPPPPPPPPVIEEVPDETILEEDEPEFVDQSVEADEVVEAPPAPPPPPPPTPPPPKESDEIFMVVEDMPLFPGCDTEKTKEDKKKCSDRKVFEFVFKNLKYPVIARENGIEGTAVVQFVVDRDGTVKDVSVLKEIGGGCGEEASRVVNTMNASGIKWTPGRQRGRPVKVQFRLPVRFKLQ